MVAGTASECYKVPQLELFYAMQQQKQQQALWLQQLQHQQQVCAASLPLLGPKTTMLGSPRQHDFRVEPSCHVCWLS